MVVWGCCESCGDELGLQQVEVRGCGWLVADVTSLLLVHVILRVKVWDLDHDVEISGLYETLVLCPFP